LVSKQVVNNFFAKRPSHIVIGVASFASGKQDPAGVPVKEIHDRGKRTVPLVV